jgi:hypothetical protein
VIFRIQAATIIMVLGVLAQGCVNQRQVQNQVRWTYNAHRADAYTIDLVSVEPKPGEKLVAGRAVTFKVKARYSMSVADKGAVVLVFQSRTRQRVEGTTPQTRIDVIGPSGTVELSRVVIIPIQTDRMQLFVPLVPDGFKQTDGEIVINYPIVEN